MPDTEAPIKPYQGPPATPDNFQDAFPDMVKAAESGRPIARALRPLEPTSQRNLDELFRQMRSHRPKAATVVNMHPWPLFFPSTELFLRGIQVPACRPGEPYAYHYIRSWNADKRYNEDGSFNFSAILPIHKAGQFLRAFSDREVYGGGVIIYEGESHPDKTGKVETYTPDGNPIVNMKKGYDFDDEGHRIPMEYPEPVMRPLAEILKEERERRNQFYMIQVEIANEMSKSPNAKQRLELTRSPKYRLMAEMLFAEGLLKSIPEWNLSNAIAQGQTLVKCPMCQTAVDPNSVKCVSCAHILKPFEAYMAGAIEYGHVSMDRLSAEEWTLVEEENARRKKARALAKKNAIKNESE